MTTPPQPEPDEPADAQRSERPPPPPSDAGPSLAKQPPDPHGQWPEPPPLPPNTGSEGQWQTGADYVGQPSNQPYPYGQPERRSQTMSILGFACAAIAILFCPILFGPAGIIFGVVGNNRGEPLGRWAAITAAVCMVIGLIINYMYFNAEIRNN
ncbi:hypothetical protein [Nocardia sp. NPDC052566]|uniref:hypothetical protein n=1 Tax=Nocardia sp. NPDC052566 TaxID=3364330 RepID=UPI0037CBEFB1